MPDPSGGQHTQTSLERKTSREPLRAAAPRYRSHPVLRSGRREQSTVVRVVRWVPRVPTDAGTRQCGFHACAGMETER